MAEYIDKMWVVNKAIQLENEYQFHKEEWNAEMLYRRIVELELEIGKQPSADVTPVRHGHWVCKRATYECSECKWEALEKTEWYGSWDVSYNQVRSDFCPHCGAIMDGGIEYATD